MFRKVREHRRRTKEVVVRRRSRVPIRNIGIDGFRRAGLGELRGLWLLADGLWT